MPARHSHPVLLAPVRIETRFKGAELWVRIYPDRFVIDTHEPGLTSEELKAGVRYRETCDAGDAATQRDAWRKLSRQFGVRRAAYMSRTMLRDRDTEPEGKAASWEQAPRLRLLPDQFEVFAYRDGALIHHVPTAPSSGFLRSDLSILAPPSALQEGLFDNESRWVVDFGLAENEGMAVRIPLSTIDRKEGFSRLIVVGLRTRPHPITGKRDLEQLFDSHHYTAGFGFVPQGSPTNNTPRAKSGYSAADTHTEDSFETEIRGSPSWHISAQHRSNAQELGHALGLGYKNEVLRYIEHAGDTGDSYARPMQLALWPSTLGYLFDYMLPGALDESAKEKLWQHFGNHIRAAGPIPTIRVGNQPYGILPVTAVRRQSQDHPHGWQKSPLDAGLNPSESSAAFDDQLHGVLNRLFERWLKWAENPDLVPRVTPDGDPDEELVKILSMQPNSTSYRARPFVSEDFISWLLIASQGRLYPDAISADTDRDLQSGEVSAVSILRDWQNQWRTKRQDAAAILNYISDTNPADSEFIDEPLLRLSGWRDGAPDPIPLTVGSDADDIPKNYLKALAEAEDPDAVESETLLCDMLKRALKLKGRSETIEALTRSALDSDDLTAPADALKFFNAVQTPEEIVDRVVDDPDFDIGPPRAYGIRISLARRILSVRDSLPNGQFTSLAQVDAIRGVGDDTWHDILYSFPDISADDPNLQSLVEPDFDRLLHQTLDLCTHRLDAWLTSLAYKRLLGMRTRQLTGTHVGAYGFVENLVPLETGPSIAVLEFFNSVVAPEEIVARIKDDPNIGTSGKGRGIGPDLSRKIISARDALPGKQFHSLAQIGEIRGVGRDTFHDILHTFVNLSEGYVHAPSAGQAATAAVLHNAFLTHADSNAERGNPYCINLHSERVRRASRILQGMREGQTLGALLGYQFERWLPPMLRRYIDNFRREYPTISEHGAAPAATPVETVAARNVVDGASLARRWQALTIDDDGTALSRPSVNTAFASGSPIAAEHGDPLAIELDRLVDTLDAVGDVLITEAVHQAVQGNYERSGAALDAASGNGYPPELASMATPISGKYVGHRVCMLFPVDSDAATGATVDDDPLIGPRAKAEPRLAAWLTDLLGPLDQIGCTTWYESLAALNQASVEDLVTQTTLAEHTARRLIDDRVKNGPFVDRRDISRRVAGLGHDDLEAIGQLVSEETLVLSLADLGADDPPRGLDAADLLYLAAAPLGGGDTEMEQRIAYHVRELRGLPEYVRVEIRADQRGSFPRSLNDAWHLAAQVMTALGGLPHCSPGSLRAPAQASGAAFEADDLDELDGRVTNAHTALEQLRSQLDIDPPYDEDTHANVINALFAASRFGVPGLIPRRPADTELESYRRSALAALDKRLAAYARLYPKVEAVRAASGGGELTAGSAKRAVSLLVAAARSLFGESFAILPTISPLDTSHFYEALVEQTVLAGLGEDRIRLWLQQAAQVHRPLQYVEDLLITAEAWRQPLLNDVARVLCLRTVQLPHRADATWLALDDDERGSAIADDDELRGAVSIVAVLPGPPVPPTNGSLPKYAGLIVHRWDELLPRRTVNTSVGFHYNAPNTQPPQCLLLAVPGQEPGSDTTPWTIDELVQILNDTFDLAKVRAVDLDALRQLDDDVDDRPDVGGVLPAVMLPTNVDRPGWAREGFSDLFNTWLASTLRRSTIRFEGHVRFTNRTQELVPFQAPLDPDYFQPVSGGIKLTWFYSGDHRTPLADGDLVFIGPGLRVAGHYRKNPPPLAVASPSLVCETGPLTIELPQPFSLVAIYCGFLNITTEEGLNAAFGSAVSAYDETGTRIGLHIHQVPSTEGPGKRWFLTIRPENLDPSTLPNLKTENPIVGFFSDPGPNPANGDFETFISEFHVSDSDGFAGRKIKRIEISGGTCLMEVENYYYPTEEPQL